MLDRHHLFISYRGGEDGTLAEWLTLRLTALGYKVWCDRVKLLGGESYPRDIDAAIKEQTFRMVALLSVHSIAKPNPVKERTLAHSIARERGEFIIPLNVDGLSPSRSPRLSLRTIRAQRILVTSCSSASSVRGFMGPGRTCGARLGRLSL